jgi:hypothetical protein
MRVCVYWYNIETCVCLTIYEADAAVAVSAALNVSHGSPYCSLRQPTNISREQVTEPSCCGIGGSVLFCASGNAKFKVIPL